MGGESNASETSCSKSRTVKVGTRGRLEEGFLRVCIAGSGDGGGGEDMVVDMERGL